jgi:cell division protein FtsI/penicillin-binding protein 2
LTGRYPTGSTFKLVTATALLEHGLTPTTPVSCPATVTIGGKVLSTFDGRAQTARTLYEAFVQSCNTAFATLGATLPDASFVRAATQLGIGRSPHLGRPAFGGAVATPTSESERATVASDGGGTTVSPFSLAVAAATIAGGRYRAPTLSERPSGRAPGPRLDRSVLHALRSMMAGSVASGTASGQGLPAGTYAKTGTAVFEAAQPPRTEYAWLTGYRGDIAFAVLVVGGTEGRPLAGPIAARFLDAVG